MTRLELLASVGEKWSFLINPLIDSKRISSFSRDCGAALVGE